MKKKIIFIILIFVFSSNLFNLFSYGYSSIDELKEDLKKYPKDPIIYMNAGIYYLFESFKEKDKTKIKKLVEAAILYLEDSQKKDTNNNKTLSYLGSAYGYYCGVINNLSDIISYGNKSVAYLDKAVNNEPYNIDFRRNRILGFIAFPPEYYKLNKVIIQDYEFLTNYIEKDINYRKDNYYYQISRAEIYCIASIVYKRMGDINKSKELMDRATMIIKEFNLRNINYYNKN